jgi:hypothetical protein
MLKRAVIERNVPKPERKNQTGLQATLRELKAAGRMPGEEPPSFWWPKTSRSIQTQILESAKRVGVKVSTRLEKQGQKWGFRVHRVDPIDTVFEIGSKVNAAIE